MLEDWCFVDDQRQTQYAEENVCKIEITNLKALTLIKWCHVLETNFLCLLQQRPSSNHVSRLMKHD